MDKKLRYTLLIGLGFTFVMSIAALFIAGNALTRTSTTANYGAPTSYPANISEILVWSMACPDRVFVSDQPDGSKMVYCYQTIEPTPTNTEIGPTETSAYPPPETIEPYPWPTSPPYPEPSQIPTNTPIPDDTETPPSPESTPTNTPNGCQCASPTPSPTLQPTVGNPSPTPTRVFSSGILVNHSSIPLFDSIPDEYITGAADLFVFFRHASVGDNINRGLDCLEGNANSLSPAGTRKSACYAGLPEGGDFYDPKYQRANWMFEFHAPPPGINPEWWNKTAFFINRISELPVNSVDVAGFKMGYVNAMNRPEMLCFFDCASFGDQYRDILDLEALESERPDIRFMYWTSSLARDTWPELSAFDDRSREYYAEKGKDFFDLADIESHNPNGELCAANGLEVICPDYTTEIHGGHLNALGAQRVAKALWVFMAQMAGWKP